MGEPERNVYDQEGGDDAPQSAYDKARAAWGMPSGDEDNNDSDTPDNISSLDEARKAKLDSSELNDAESSGATQNNQAPSGEEGVTDDSDEDSGWSTNVEKESKRKIFASTRSRVGVGVAGVGVAGIIGFSSFMAPTLLVNHLRELLLNKVSKVQTRQSQKNGRKKCNKIADAFTPDGRRGGRMIAEMEAKGYKFAFNGNKMVGITPPGANSSIVGDAMGEHLSDYMEISHPLRTSRWKTKKMEAFYNRYKVSRGSPAIRGPDDPEDPEEAVNQNMADDVFGDEAETRPKTADASPDETAEEKQAREAADAASLDVTKNDGIYDDLKTKLKSGVSVDDLTDEEKALLKVGVTVDQDLIDIAKKAASTQTLGAKSLSTLKSFFNPADILDKVCTIKNRLTAIQYAARNFRALSLLRYTSSFIKVADATRAGPATGKKIDPGMLNVLMKRVTSLDSNGNPIGASPGMAYIIKGKFSKSKNDSFKGSYAVDGKLGGLPGGIQNATNTIPGLNGKSCGIIQSPITQVGVAVVQIGAAIFSGGSSAAIEGGARTAAVTAFKEALQNIISKQTLLAVTKSIALDISFEGVLAITQILIEKSISIPFTGQEKGGQLGDVLSAGAGTLNKQRSLGAGMVPATTTEYAIAQQTFLAEKKEEQKHQSFYARFLDYSNPDSLAFETVTQVAMSPAYSISSEGYNVSNLARSIISTPTNVFSSMFGFFSGRAFAQSDPDEISTETLDVAGNSLATDPAGNILPIMRSDIEDIDPEINAKQLVESGDIDVSTLEPISSRFNDHIKNCVDEPDIITTMEKDGSQEKPETDCLAKLDITKKFKAHLAYLDMLDGVDASIFPEEIGSGGSASTSSTSNTPVAGNTADFQCATGTVDKGESDGYQGGDKYRIRLCEIPGFKSSSDEDSGGLVRVNSTASENWLKTFQNAKAGGITLEASSSFRSMAKQQYLYACYQSGGCNGGNVAAKPGFSNHQIGFAIDIRIVSANQPSLTECQASPDSYPIYKWLAQNAPSNKINAGVPSECWHWSVGGK